MVFFVFTGYFLIEGTRKSEELYFRKKIIRLVPLYWLLTITLFIVSLLMPGINGGKSYTWSNLIQSLLFIPYYSADGKLFPILSVGWTLILEVYEYIVFWALYKGFKKNKHRDIMSVIAFAFLVIMGKVLSTYYISTPIIVIWSYKYQWAFLIGMLISIVKNGQYQIVPVKQETVNVNFILISYATLFAICTYFINDSFALILGVLATAIGLIVFPKLRFSKWIVGFGNLSYSFYLIHKFVIAFVDKIVTRLFSGTVTGVVGVLLSFILTLLASIVSYQMIEKRLSAQLKQLLCR